MDDRKEQTVYKAEIDGEAVTLIGQESQEYFDTITKYLNQKISAIRKSKKGQALTPQMMKLLIYINICDDLFKERTNYDLLYEKFERHVKEYHKILGENDFLKERNEELNLLLTEKEVLEDLGKKYDYQRLEMETIVEENKKLKTEVENLQSTVDEKGLYDEMYESIRAENEELHKMIDELEQEKDSTTPIEEISIETQKIFEENLLLQDKISELQLLLQKANYDLADYVQMFKDV